MRIALFSGNYNYLREGANQALNKLVCYLEEASGHQVRVYSPVTDTPAFEPAGTLVPVPSVTLPVRGEFQLALGLPSSIRRDLDRFAPDLVHVSTPDILDTRAQTWALRRGLPVVASMHTRFETYFDYYGLGWLKPLAEAHLRRFYRRASHVLAPTPGLVAEMHELRGDSCASVWSRGVDRDRFNPAHRDLVWRRRQGIGDDEVAVLFFGRLVLEKGIVVYAEAIRMLRDRGVAVRPLVVGAGPAASLFEAIPGSVLTGHLDGEALARAVASADVMVAPSTTETFGNVVTEAMASGLAVVAAEAPSNRALIRDGKTGFIVPATDPAAYADAVAKLDAGRRASIGGAAREESANYSWDTASANVEAVYRSFVRT